MWKDIGTLCEWKRLRTSRAALAFGEERHLSSSALFAGQMVATPPPPQAVEEEEGVGDEAVAEEWGPPLFPM